MSAARARACARARLSRGRNLHLLSSRDLCLSFRYAAPRSPYRRSPVGGEPFHRRAVRTPASTRERPGNSSSGCSRYDCWCSSSPNRRHAFSLPRNPARRLSSRVRPPIRTKDRIPLPEAKSYHSDRVCGDAALLNLAPSPSSLFDFAPSRLILSRYRKIGVFSPLSPPAMRDASEIALTRRKA